ncbi:reverse transcriptase family protein [Williamsia sp. D3]|uniref:reverse transcriptase family protein n=1 Tax=Williamsia sp. D3 TaxID=1313067 RepID=UPI0003D2DB19|nr:RNA-directed DNA polymerase [Williamsia sp. D3]
MTTDSAHPDDLGGLGPGIRIPARSLDLLVNRLEVDPRWSVHALGDMLPATTAPATATALLGLLLEKFPERPEPEAVRRALGSMVIENRSHVFGELQTPEMTLRAVFAAVGYRRTSRLLSEICTTATPPDALRELDFAHASLLRARHLPQGAPTSPALANLVMRTMDRRIWGYARHNNLHYSRYGDDLAISGDVMDAGQVLWTVLRIIADEGFTVHPDKTKIMYSHQRQQLAGLVVNDRPRVGRADYDNLRALLHNAIRTGAHAQNRDDHPRFREHVYGKIAWIAATSPARRNTLLAMAERVDWDR